MIGELASSPHATVPGPVVLIIVLLLAVCFGVRVWCEDADRRDMERREQWRRDQQAQREWDEYKRASAQSRPSGPRVLP